MSDGEMLNKETPPPDPAAMERGQNGAGDPSPSPPAPLPQSGEGSKNRDGHIEQVVFDVRGVTARDYYQFRTGIPAQKKLFKRVIREFPAGWGDPRKDETWRSMTFARLVKLRARLTSELDATKAEDVPGLAFEVEAVTVQEMEKLTFETTPQMMAKYTASTPAWWEQPVTADTYLDLPYGVYARAGELFMEAVNDLGKN